MAFKEMQYLMLLTCAFSFASCNADHQANAKTETVTAIEVNATQAEVVEKQTELLAEIEEEEEQVTALEEKTVPKKVTKETVKEVAEAVKDEDVTPYTQVADPPRPEPEILTAVEIEEVKEEPVAPKVLDIYSYWDGATKRLVTSSGMVNYADWKQEEAKLDGFLAELGAVKVTDLGRNAQLAYWINFYNAATVKLILNNYPLKRITDLDKPWDQKWIKAGAKTLSLNDIEHKIIRPQFKDPRIHAAVNCAAVSCPRLLNEAFRPETVDAQLDSNMQDWLFKSGKNKLGETSIELSKIFEWYAVDFGDLVPYINKVSGKNYSADTPISYLEYNWELNKK